MTNVEFIKLIAEARKSLPDVESYTGHDFIVPVSNPDQEVLPRIGEKQSSGSATMLLVTFKKRRRQIDTEYTWFYDNTKVQR